MSGSLAFGIASLLAGPPADQTLAQATPGASPVASDGYANGETLVDVDWLNTTLPNNDVVLVALMPKDVFGQGHIPGSVQVDWPEMKVVDTSDESIATWRSELESIVGRLGISADRTVVTYDDGTLFAARMWWILRYLGHVDVHVLNGGRDAWSDAGLELDEGQAADASPSYSFQADPQPAVLAQLQDVLAELENEDVIVVDARTSEEYADGHIPGAVNVNYPLNALPEPPRFWKPADELMAMYEQVGVTMDRKVIPYCSTGVRSAVTAFTLHLLGYADVALYTGSWEEWGNDPDTPKTTGNQP
jgi:thiosulfate/3-mercaptopyruvate sulfurtransferase